MRHSHTAAPHAPADPKVGGRLAALGRACYRHRRWVLGFWVVVLALGVLIGGRVFEGTVASTGAGGSESARGEAVVQAADPVQGTVTAVVDGAAATDPAVRAAVTAATAEIAGLPGVASVADTYGAGGSLTSADGNASLVSVRMADAGTPAQLDAVTHRLADIGAPGRT